MDLPLVEVDVEQVARDRVGLDVDGIRVVAVVDITVAGQEFDVSRKGVFEERASAVYAPPDEPITIVAGIGV